MRISIVLTILILIAGGLFGVRNQSRLTALREDRRDLISRAVEKGIPLDSKDSAADLKVAKRQRQDREERDRKARELSLELLVMAGEIERAEKGGRQPDPALQKRGVDLLSKMLVMDAAQIKIIIAAMRDDASLSPKTRSEMVLISILVMGQEHPSAALAFYAESSDLLEKGSMGNSAVSMTLSRWAENDPMAALDWIRKNAAAHPEIVTEEAKRGIVAGATRTDPQLAFKLIGELGFEDSAEAVHSLVSSARTPEQRSAVLTALREHLAGIQDPERRTDLLQESLESMGRELSNERFDAVNTWMTAAKLTPDETVNFAEGLSYFNTKEDTGRWIEWMASNLPVDRAAANASDLVGQWTQQDYQAAGKWLATAPAGPAKDASIATYAETVAEYEPRIAVEWANLLPEGRQRQDAFETILENWPKTDSEGAAAFAREHDLDKDPLGDNDEMPDRPDGAGDEDSKEEP